MKSRTVIVVLVLGVLLILSVFLLRTETQNEETANDDIRSALALPDSPLGASYMVNNREVTLVDGHATEKQAPDSASTLETSIFGSPVLGDLNDDGVDDAAVLLTQQGGGSGTFYYAAVAVHTPNGYIGTNAVLLGDRIAPDTVQIRDGVVVVNYATRGESEPMTEAPSLAKTAYLTLSGATLQLQGPFEKGEEILWGNIVYGDEVRTFTPCGQEEPYWIDPAGRANSALEIVHTERTRGLPPYTPAFVVVAGTVTPAPDDGFGADYAHAFRVRLVLHAPRSGTCDTQTSGDTEDLTTPVDTVE